MRYRIIIIGFAPVEEMAKMLNAVIGEIGAGTQMDAHVVACVHVPALGLVYTVELR